MTLWTWDLFSQWVYIFIVWVNRWAGKIKRIRHSDWLQWIRFEKHESATNRAKINAAQQDATSVKETRWQYEVPGDSTMREMEQCTIFLPIQWWPNTSSNLRYSVLIPNVIVQHYWSLNYFWITWVFCTNRKKKTQPSSSIQKSSVYFKSQNFLSQNRGSLGKMVLFSRVTITRNSTL